MFAVAMYVADATATYLGILFITTNIVTQMPAPYTFFTSGFRAVNGEVMTVNRQGVRICWF
jgi:hypothetical protein